MTHPTTEGKEPKTDTKAYQIDLSKIYEGFQRSPICCHAEGINKAKSILLKKIKHDGMELLYSDEEISYINIPVIRYPECDLIEFECEYLTQSQINRITEKRNRIAYFTQIIENESVTHCYIRKHGSYYRSHAAGYTGLKVLAGIFTKEEAVTHGKSCEDLQIIPINREEHNKMIVDEIAELESRLILHP